MKKILFISLVFALFSCQKDIAAKEVIGTFNAEKTLLNYLATNQQADNKIVVSSQHSYVTNGGSQTAVLNYSAATVIVKPQTGGNGCLDGCLEVNN